MRRTWGARAGEGKMLFCPQLLASLAGDSMQVACWIAQQVDLRTVWFVFEEEVGLMGVSPVPGISLGSLWFFQTKSGLEVITSVLFFWVLKCRRVPNYGCRRKEMQSAAVLSLFCPLLQTTLNKYIAQTQSNSCSFCYSGAFFSLAICLAAIFFLIPPLSLKRESHSPTKYQLHFTYWITRWHQSCQSPARLSWPSPGIHNIPWHTTTSAVVIFIILMQ